MPRGSRRMISRGLRIVELSALLFLLISPVHAQQSAKKAYAFRGKVEKVHTSPKPLTVTNEQMALANNPTMAQVQASLRAAAGLTKQAGLYPNPTVGYYGDEIRGGYSRGGKQGGFVSQTIVTGGKLRAASRVAKLQADQVETSGQIQRLRVVNNVRSLFYQVLAAQRLVEVRQNLAKLAADATLT